jgi:hypothetical protein
MTGARFALARVQSPEPSLSGGDERILTDRKKPRKKTAQENRQR